MGGRCTVFGSCQLPGTELPSRCPLTYQPLLPTKTDSLHPNIQYATENSQYHKLVEIQDPDYTRTNSMILEPSAGAGGFSGAATVPNCRGTTNATAPVAVPP